MWTSDDSVETPRAASKSTTDMKVRVRDRPMEQDFRKDTLKLSVASSNEHLQPAAETRPVVRDSEEEIMQKN